MGPLYYICKYTPVELLAGFGASCRVLNGMPKNFDRAEAVGHPNLCGFGKAVLEEVLSGRIRKLVLVNCCDTIRRIYDILKEEGNLDFLYFMDLVHEESQCGRERMVWELKKLARAYGEYAGRDFDPALFAAAFSAPRPETEPYVAVMGGRMGDPLLELAQQSMPLRVANHSCVGNRSVIGDIPAGADVDGLLDWYAGALLHQLPCMRMHDVTGRKALLNDPNLRGILYHTVKFCDYYGFEYAGLKNHAPVPLLKIESDYTVQSSGQLRTRLEAFAECLAPAAPKTRQKERTGMEKLYFAGIDSGSTSTDVVILNENKEIVAKTIYPTGAGAAAGAKRALDSALEQAGLTEADLAAAVTTGYGRSALHLGDKSVTEISCHARGAFFLDPSIRTIIDIGGQDSKVIRVDDTGNVVNFVMNDKCAAGTGRFLDMMAKTLEMSLEELSHTGLKWKEDITISSMCTVFAESEIVSLVAENKSLDDIVHGLNQSVAGKTVNLVKRAGGLGAYMMTGGVAQNAGVVQAIEARLGEKLRVSPMAQYCGALGAALFAMETV